MTNKTNVAGLAVLGTLVLSAVGVVLDQGFDVALSPTTALWINVPLGLALLYYAILKRSLTTWIIVTMVIGVGIGYFFPEFSQNLKVLSKVFLKLIKTTIAPLLFATLVVGIAGHADIKKVGRMGLKSLIYFEVVTTLALFVGLAAINLTQAGSGVVIPPSAGGDAPTEIPPPQNWMDIILHIFPENIAKSIVEGQVLQIVVFSILFAVGLAMVEEKKRKPMLEFAESLSETMFKVVKVVMYFAPIGVGAAMAYTVGHMGLDVLKNLFFLLGTLYLALIFFVLAVLLPVALLFRVPIRKFLKAVREPASLAFATTSSEAALPVAMENMTKFGVPKDVVAFVMPTGYSFNLDGTTLYLSLASVFVAQAAGMDLSLGQQLVMCFTLMLTSKGVAGVPRASFVILLGTIAMFDLPVEVAFAILGIDELMDMARTTVNVVGNCLASVVVARWEGVFDDKAANAY